jgi:hypothetical protein
MTQEPADRTCFMAVVDLEVFYASSRIACETYGTLPRLFFQHTFVVVYGYAVLPLVLRVSLNPLIERFVPRLKATLREKSARLAVRYQMPLSRPFEAHRETRGVFEVPAPWTKLSVGVYGDDKGHSF